MLKRTLCRATLFDDLSNNNNPQADSCAQIRRTSVKLYSFLSKERKFLSNKNSFKYSTNQVARK